MQTVLLILKRCLAETDILKEIEAPAPYTFDKDKEYPFTMKDTDNQGYFTTIENAKEIEKTKDVSAQKVWEGTQKVKPTIYFKLYKQDDNQKHNTSRQSRN